MCVYVYVYVFVYVYVSVQVGDDGAGHIAAEGLKLAVPELEKINDYQRGLFWRQYVYGRKVHF